MSSRLAIVLLVGTALLAYANSVGGGWVWDDYPLIVQKRAFYGDPANIPSALISPDRALPESGTSYYRPLAALNYFADRAVFGVEPAGYHLESVVLHIAITVLFWHLLAGLFRDPQLALVAALVFAVHPVNAEAVNFISARNNLLCAVFMLASLDLLQRGRVGAVRIALAHGAFALALLAKEPAIVLPAFLVCTWRSDAFRGWRAVTVAGFGVISASYLVLRFFLLGHITAGQEFGSAGLGLPLAALYEDFRLLFFPLELNALYRLRAVPLLSPRAAIVILVLLALGFAAWRGPRPLRWASAWTLLSLAPVANIIPIPSAPVAERYLYIPAMGAALIAACGLRALSRVSRGAGFAVGALLLALLLTQTVLRNGVWRDGETLARSMIASDPWNTTPHVLLGIEHRRAGRYDDALEAYGRALELDPDNAWVYANRGNVFLEQRDTERAMQSFEMALRLDPRKKAMIFHIGMAAEAGGKTAVASDHYARFIEAASAIPGSHHHFLIGEARARLAALRGAEQGGN